MLRRLRVVVGALLLADAAVLALHEGRVPDRDNGRVAAVDAAPSSPLATSSSVAPAPSPATQRPPKSNKTTATTLAALTSSGDYHYDVTLSPTCVSAGTPMTATLRLKPGAGGVLMAVYADGSDHEARHAAIAKEDGLVTKTWVAAPVVGEGQLLTQATDGTDQTRKGSTIVRFRVVAAGASC